MNSDVADVTVVGAGMTGLIAARRLAQRGLRVHLVERDSEAGGLAASFVPSAGGDPLERFYHHIFRSDRKMIALIGELGVADRLRWHEPATQCWHRDGRRRLDTPASLLRFDRVPVVDRLRLACALAILKLVPTAAPFEKVPAAKWLRRIAGVAAYDAIFAPLFASKFGSRAEEISLAWFWARIHDRTSTLGYVDGGFAEIYARIATAIADDGGIVSYGCTVEGIRRADGSFATTLRRASDGSQRTISSRFVISTAPLPVLARMCEQIDARFVDAHATDCGLSARCLILALDRPLTGDYWINMCETDSPFMVAVEHTALVSPSRYGGKHIVYLGNYRDVFPNDDERALLDGFVPTLRALNHHFDPSWVTDLWSFSAPHAQPIVTIDYRSKIAPIRTPVEGLFHANLYQVYPHDRGQNYAVELGERVADIVARSAS